jgi:hypothetical protein
MPIDRPKNEVHHWWPRAVSKFWQDAEGYAHQIDNAGKVVRSRPKSFGGVRNDNNITFKSSPTVWDMSFEKVYTKADDGFRPLMPPGFIIAEIINVVAQSASCDFNESSERGLRIVVRQIVHFFLRYKIENHHCGCSWIAWREGESPCGYLHDLVPAPVES